MKIYKDIEAYENVRQNFYKVVSHYLWLMLCDIEKYGERSRLKDGYFVSDELIDKFKEIAQPLDSFNEFEKYMIKSLIDIKDRGSIIHD